MTQSFESTPQPPQMPAPNLAAELQKMQVLANLNRRIKSGANNFYWIAGLSVINSFAFQFGGSIYFVVGLAGTMFVDGIFIGLAKALPDMALVVKIFGLVVSMLVAGVFALLGYFAGKGKRWAFITGMILYAVDALVMMVFQEWMGLIFHGIFLFGLFGGLQALNQLQKTSPPPSQITDSFPQNIGTS
jgi:hypothetical protein